MTNLFGIHANSGSSCGIMLLAQDMNALAGTQLVLFDDQGTETNNYRAVTFKGFCTAPRSQKSIAQSIGTVTDAGIRLTVATIMPAI